MIHYHGTPIGGKRARADEFASGRFLLVPWKRPEDLERASELSRGFIIDNSAFSFWATGERPDWSEYVSWCRDISRSPRFHFALIPDVIDGTEAENDELIANWSVEIAGCPVWHLHESLDRLDGLLRWGRVAIGSSGQWPTPGVGDWWQRMDEAFEAICDSDGFPRTKVHGLRMLRSDIVARYPFSSADSTNAVQNGAREAEKNGVDSLWGSMTIARRIEQVQSPSRFVRSDVRQSFMEFVNA